MDNASIRSISTNDTAANLPGAGRTIGLFYDFAGKKLQNKMNRVAEKFGHGPRATALKIEKALANINANSNGRSILSFSLSKSNKLTKRCNRLLSYVGCVSLYI